MKPVFADTGFWIALLHKKDRWHQQAIKISQNLQSQKKKIVTSEMVFTEFLNFFSKFDTLLRQEAGLTVQRMQSHPNVIIIAANNQQFTKALELYLKRPDKGWSLTDCSSFQIMEELELTEAIAHDKHCSYFLTWYLWRLFQWGLCYSTYRSLYYAISYDIY